METKVVGYLRCPPRRLLEMSLTNALSDFHRKLHFADWAATSLMTDFVWKVLKSMGELKYNILSGTGK